VEVRAHIRPGGSDLAEVDSLWIAHSRDPQGEATTAEISSLRENNRERQSRRHRRICGVPTTFEDIKPSADSQGMLRDHGARDRSFCRSRAEQDA
jgi:hypothetical protein